MNRLLICAYDKGDARRAAAAIGCPEHGYTYVHRRDDLRGWGADAKLVITPGFWLRGDAEELAEAVLEWRVGFAPSADQPIHGLAGSVGPTGGTTDLHVYARDVQSGAGNCVCARHLGHHLHVQAAPGVWVPRSMRGPERVPPTPVTVGPAVRSLNEVRRDRGLRRR